MSEHLGGDTLDPFGEQAVADLRRRHLGPGGLQAFRCVDATRAGITQRRAPSAERSVY